MQDLLLVHIEKSEINCTAIISTFSSADIKIEINIKRFFVWTMCRVKVIGGGFFYSEYRAPEAIGTLPHRPHNRSSRKRREIPFEAIKVRGQEIAAKQGVPGVASVQARAPAGREGGREFQALGPDKQKGRSPTVFSLKVGAAKLRKTDDLKVQTGVQSPNSSVRYEVATPLRALKVMVKIFSSMRLSVGNKRSSFKIGET